MFIPDPGFGFLTIPDPGSRGQKGTGYRTWIRIADKRGIFGFLKT
jgi:hypothetical protein